MKSERDRMLDTICEMNKWNAIKDERIEELEKQLANKNDKCEALYSALYTILEEQAPENVASQIEQITKQNFDKENETFKENRNVMQLLKIVQDQKQQLAITEEALELAVVFIEDITGSCPYDSELIGMQNKCVECTDDIKNCWNEYFKTKAKEMLENDTRRN